ncbi:hypothetical protein [Geoglobus acetivorans]|uniref:Uncharacterized protein n=1 Tax=Geoglobus acetivorans TaxID=565033 RepID=A0ABZ3H2X2_GEOAI|nr:hypothetical protein [Geoglobus acetivorans]
MQLQVSLDANFRAITRKRKIMLFVKGKLSPFALSIGQCIPHEDYGYLICDWHRGRRILFINSESNFVIVRAEGTCMDCSKKSRTGHMAKYRRCWADRFYLILEDDIHETVEEKLRELKERHEVKVLEESVWILFSPS